MKSSLYSLDQWREDVKQRVGFFLEPVAINSLLIIQPAASGDVALTTTLIAQVKAINPRCKITLLTREGTARVARFCPQVDVVETLRPELALLGRRELLQRFAGWADRVVHVWYFGENSDLGERYNFLETIWLLAGWPSPPDRPVAVNLQVPGGNRDIDSILRDLIGFRAMVRSTEASWREVLLGLKKALAQKSFRKAGLRTVVSRFSHLIRAILPAWWGLSIARRRCVIISPFAFSVSPPPPELWPMLVQKLKKEGWLILHNVFDPGESFRGTIPLVCSYEDFLALRQRGVPLVAWRSGLCDMAAAVKSVPMAVLYPRYTPPHARSTIEHFGFEALGIEVNSLELECDSIEAMDWNALLEHIAGNSRRS